MVIFGLCRNIILPQKSRNVKPRQKNGMRKFPHTVCGSPFATGKSHLFGCPFRFNDVFLDFPAFKQYNKLHEVILMKITVVQPPYFAGENPDEKIADFLIKELEKVEKNSLIVLPEYSNAGGISDAESEKAAMPRAKAMLHKAAVAAKEKSAYVAINVLEERDRKIKNSTYLFDKLGQIAFVYDKIHLPPSEISLGVEYGDGTCVCDLDGIRFGFLTCYDVYFQEQIEYLALQKCDIILIPGYQRGESTDIIRAQTKMIAFRCNCFVAKSSYSMDSDEKGGCSMIAAPDGKILRDMGKETGHISAEVDPHQKHMRTAGFGGGMIRNDDFINAGLRPEIFRKNDI